MSGPRISTGSDSKQDYSTPRRFLDAVEKRFGTIVFDLAAHAGNHIVPRYFAPRAFTVKVKRGETDIEALIAGAVKAGANEQAARHLVFEQWTLITDKGTIRIPNADFNAVAMDALHTESGARRNWRSHYGDGLGWLNPEFSDIDPWAAECAYQTRCTGASSLLLTPAVFANWHHDHIAGVADVYELSGRLCFDGKNVFPKDCRLSHFWPGSTGKVCIWDWQRDVIHRTWLLFTPNAVPEFIIR